MKLVEVNKSNHVFRVIGTLKDQRINRDILKSQADRFIGELKSYVEDLSINNPDLKVADLLNEDFIMSGKFPPILVEAISKVGGTSITLDAFAKLGFTLEEPKLDELNRFMADGYTVMRDVIKNLWDGANADIAEVNADKEVYLDMIRVGVKVSAEQFLSFPKYCILNGITPVTVAGENGEELDSNFFTSHEERYNEWVEREVEKTIIDLFTFPKDAIYVAPIGMDAFLKTLRSLSAPAYDLLTEYGSNLNPTITNIKSPEFTGIIKRLSNDQKVAIVTAIQDFNNKNTTGELAVNGGNVPIPSAVSIIDVIIGFMIHASVVVGMTVEALGEEASESEVFDAIPDESVKEYIDMIADKMKDYPNPAGIAMNLASIPGKLIPMYIFANPAFRITQVPELNELNANIYGILFTDENKGDGSNEQ
ncbi:MAG: hypothetical protein ACRCX8_16640 [Sarcina sp.]